MHYFYFFIALLITTAAFAAEDQVTKSIPKIRIGIIKDPEGNISGILYNSQGYKEPLGLGNLVANCCLAIVGEKYEKCQTYAPIEVGVEKDSHQQLSGYIKDHEGKKFPYSLTNLILSLSKTLQVCEKKEKTEKKNSFSKSVYIHFEKEPNGTLAPLIEDPDHGHKELLNLGNILSNIAEAFPGCEPSLKQERFVQIVLEGDEKEKTIPMLVDVFGIKEELTFENLVIDAIETVQNCQMGMPAKSKRIKNSIEILFIKNPQGRLRTYLIDSANHQLSLHLGALLKAVYDASPFPKSNEARTLEISFEREKNGALEGFILDSKGNKSSLDVPNLIKAAL